MSKTNYKIIGRDFYINGAKTYSEYQSNKNNVQGLLFNTRFIQGCFEDKELSHRGIYDRFGKTFDADRNTQDLIDALPQWYAHGVRAITIGIQGGGPIYTFHDWSVIKTGLFSEDGALVDEKGKQRLLRIIRACDELGMLCIVSILYQAQVHWFKNEYAIMQAVRSSCEFLAESSFDNIIIEIANEHNVGDFSNHPIICQGKALSCLIHLAKEWSHHKFAVGSSAGGGEYFYEVAEASDVILVHGNTLRRSEMYQFLKSIQLKFPNKPIVCNEDSPMLTQLAVAVETHTSWGYYNNATKQEPPANWEITAGEDEYFCKRLLGYINDTSLPNELYLQGFEKDTNINEKRYIRVASLYPREIDFVRFYEDDTLLDTAFEEPFFLYALTTWEQKPYMKNPAAKEFIAEVHMTNKEIKILKHQLDQ